MKTIRVALMTMRPRLRDILTDALVREADVELIDWGTGRDEDLPAAHPDVLVCESPDPLDVVPPTGLLRSMPEARVLVVADSGDEATLFELRLAQTVMRTVGIDQVIAAIKFGVPGFRAGPVAEHGTSGIS
jgi:hypothetical protein